MSRVRRRLAGCSGVVLGVLGLTALGVVGFGVFVSTGGGNRWLKARLEGLAAAQLSSGSLSIGALEFDLGTGLRLDDVVLRDGDGEVVVSVGRLVADLDLGAAYTAHTLRLPRVRAEDVVADVRVDEEGVLDLTRMFGGPSDTPSTEPFSLPFPLDLPDVELVGVHARYRTPDGVPFELAGVDATAAVRGRGTRIGVHGLSLAGQLAAPGPVATVITGELVWDSADGVSLDGVELRIPHGTAVVTGTISDRVDLGATVSRVEARALDPFVADVGIGGIWAGSLAVKGPPSHLAVTAGMRGLERSEGSLVLDGALDLSGERPEWRVDGQLAKLHVEHLYTPLAEPVVVDGVVHLEGSGLGWPDDLEARGTWTGGPQVLYGLDVDRVAVGVSLRSGVLHLDDVGVDGIVGPLKLGGTVDLYGRALDVTIDGALEPDRLEALGVGGLEGDGTVSLVVTSDLAAEDAPVRVDGTVRYAPFRYGPDVRVDRLTAPVSMTVTGGRIRGRVDLRGSGVYAYGLVGGELAADTLRFTRVDDRTTVEGAVTLGGVAYSTLVTARTTTTALSVVMEGEHRQIDANVTLGEHTWLYRPGTGGSARVGIRDDRVDWWVQLQDFGRDTLDAEGVYGLSDASVTVQRARVTPTPRIELDSQGPWSMTLADGGVKDAIVRLAGPLGNLEVRGDLSSEGELDATVSVRGLELDTIAELYPDQADGLSGRMDLELVLRGTGLAPEVDGRVDLVGLFAADSVRWLDVAGPFTWRDGVLSPELALGVAGAPFGWLTGTVPLSGGLSGPAPDLGADAHLSLALVPGDFERLAHVSPSVPKDRLPTGRLSGVLELDGPLRDPDLRLAGVAEVAVTGWRTPGRLELDVRRSGGTLTVSTDLREGLETRATVGGGGATRLGELTAWAVGEAESPDLADLDLYLADMHLDTVLLGVPLRSLSDAAGSPVDLSGELLGGFVVTGSPTRPVVDGGLNWLDPRIGTEPLEGAFLSVLPEGEGYRLQSSLAFRDGGALDIGGTVPVVVDLSRDRSEWAAGPMALTLGGPGVPLRVLSGLDPEIRDAVGLVEITGVVGGTVLAPEPELRVRLAGGEASYRPLGVAWRDIGLELELDARKVRLVALDAELGPSRRFQASGFTEAGGRPRIHASGSARLEDWKPTAMSARVDLSDGPWLSATDATTLRMDGSLQVSGAWPGLHVDGGLDVVYGRVVMDAATFLEAAPLEPSTALRIVRPQAVMVEPAADEPPLYADFDVQVDIDLKRNLELQMALPFVDDLGALGAAVSRVDLSTRLGGDVDLALEGGAPTLVGEVDLLEGKVRMLRSAFDLKEGTISFAGGDPYEDAILDVTAEMVVPGATLEMTIGGTPPAPEIAFRSDEYPDRTQQMTLLLTGQAPDELTSDEGAGAAQALAGLFLNSLFAGQSLGTFSIEPDGSVRLGVPVSQSIYAASKLSPTTDPTENSLTLEVEWSLLPRLVAAGAVGDRVSWADLYWEIRF